MTTDEKRNGLILRVILLEGAANLLVLGMKATVGFATGSMAVLADTVRSRWIGPERAVDVIVTVAASLSTVQSHTIADEVEKLLETEFEVTDITVHVEPMV